MDKEQARFILRSFRPDGTDAPDPEFASALQLAMRDAELSEWFANERAADSEFADALQTIEIPEFLRHEILDSLAYQRGEMPHIESPEDDVWARALASIEPPAGMRDRILTAMHASAGIPRVPVPAWKKFGIPAAAAAAVALALALPTSVWDRSKPATAQSPPKSGIFNAANIDRLPLQSIRNGFISTLQSPEFTLDTGLASHREIMRHLEERGLPCPTCMPPGLRGMEGVGCRELIIDGRRGTIVCYKYGEEGMVHLVIFRAEDIADPLPFRRDAVFAQDGEWAAASWRNNENAFVLVGHTDVERIASLF